MIKNQKGFTLIELMFSVGISTMLAYAIFASMRVTSTSFETDSVRMTLQTSAREGLYRMVQEIRESSPGRTTITGGNTLTFSIPNPTTPVTAGYAINWGDQIQYAIGTGANSTKIIRTDLTTNVTTVMASDVTALSFTGNTVPPSRVTVSLSVQRSLTNGRNVPATAMQLSGQAKLRNT